MVFYHLQYNNNEKARKAECNYQNSEIQFAS